MSMSGLRGEIATACPSKHTRQLRFYGSEQESVTPPDLMGILILGNSGYTGRMPPWLISVFPPEPTVRHFHLVTTPSGRSTTCLCHRRVFTEACILLCAPS